LREFGNRVLRILMGPKRDETTEGWRRHGMYNEYAQVKE
jgi:hypothetical protein